MFGYYLFFLQLKGMEIFMSQTSPKRSWLFLSKYWSFWLLVFSMSSTLYADTMLKYQRGTLATSNHFSRKYSTQAQLSAVSSWEISGAIFARNQAKGWSATLYWLQKGLNQYQIRLVGPIGSGAVIINKKSGVVTYRDGPHRFSAVSAENLLKKQTGISLPVNNLYYWVRGIPAPGPIGGSEYHHKLLFILRQAGYIVEYRQYMTVGKLVLPKQIILHNKNVFIKLAIRRWIIKFH